MTIASTLKYYMKRHKVKYNTVTHPHTLTSMDTAAAAHVSGDCVAKSVILKDDKGYVMAIVPSTHKLELGKLHDQLHRELGLATEGEISRLFKDCELGAIPPVGPAYDIETVLDDSLSEQDDIYFEAGDHEELIHISGKQFQHLLPGVEHGRFSHHV